MISSPLTQSLGLTLYAAYKSSGVDSVAEVPAHWEVRRLKHWVDINNRVLPESTDPDYTFRYVDIGSVSTGLLLEPPRELTFSVAPSRARRIVQSGDTIVSTVRTYLKAIFFVDHVDCDLVCSTGFAVLTPRCGAIPKFLSYLVQCNSFTDRVAANSTGTAYPAISENQLGTLRVAIPNVSEQEAIVRYLDWVDRGIRRYVAAKRRLIALLEEERQAIISRAVTRGLDPSVRLRPPGVEWLGDVPAHWEIRRLKGLVDNVVDLTKSPCSDEIYLALEHVESWTGKITPPDDGIVFDSQVKRFRPGDVLFGKLRPYLAKVACPSQPGVCVSEFLVLRSRTRNLTTNFLESLLRSRPVVDAIASSTFGARMPRADWQFIGNMRIPLPPIREQEDVARHLDQAIISIDVTIARARRQIELLEEYRTRLVADVVTGKLDVREAAAQLPDEDDGELNAKGAASPDDPGSDHDDASAERADVESGMRARGQ